MVLWGSEIKSAGVCQKHQALQDRREIKLWNQAQCLPISAEGETKSIEFASSSLQNGKTDSLRNSSNSLIVLLPFTTFFNWCHSTFLPFWIRFCRKHHSWLISLVVPTKHLAKKKSNINLTNAEILIFTLKLNSLPTEEKPKFNAC